MYFVCSSLSLRSGNQRDFHGHHRFLPSRMSYSWNYSVCSLFKVASSLSNVHLCFLYYPFDSLFISNLDHYFMIWVCHSLVIHSSTGRHLGHFQALLRRKMSLYAFRFRLLHDMSFNSCGKRPSTMAGFCGQSIPSTAAVAWCVPSATHWHSYVAHPLQNWTLLVLWAWGILMERDDISLFYFCL